MRINLGSGWKPQPGWMNIDLYAEVCDVRCDLRTLTFAPESVDEAMAIHTLEHFTREDCELICRDVLLFLKPGSTFVVEMPERDRCITLIQSGIGKQDENGLPGMKRRVMNGTKGLLGGRNVDKQEWGDWLLRNAATILERTLAGESTVDLIPEKFDSPGYPHLHVWSEGEFAKMLLSIGYREARIEKPVWHGPRYSRDMRVVGVK